MMRRLCTMGPSSCSDTEAKRKNGSVPFIPGEKLSREQFIRDIKEAIRYGHEINERLAEARERCPLAVAQEETRTPSAA